LTPNPFLDILLPNKEKGPRGMKCPKFYFDNLDETLYCEKYRTKFPSFADISSAEILEAPKQKLEEIHER
jgi:hypothetical protein